MARVLIVGGGCRGRRLGRDLIGAGHAVRITTRAESGRAAIEAIGAECWIGDPDRIATLRQALDRVTVACWMLGTATGEPEALGALFGTRLEYWLTQVIDTTVRGFVYEAAGTVASQLLGDGLSQVRTICELNSIPYAVIEAQPPLGAGPPGDARWLEAAREGVESFLRPSS